MRRETASRLGYPVGVSTDDNLTQHPAAATKSVSAILHQKRYRDGSPTVSPDHSPLPSLRRMYKETTDFVMARKLKLVSQLRSIYPISVCGCGHTPRTDAHVSSLSMYIIDRQNNNLRRSTASWWCDWLVDCLAEWWVGWWRCVWLRYSPARTNDLELLCVNISHEYLTHLLHSGWLTSLPQSTNQCTEILTSRLPLPLGLWGVRVATAYHEVALQSSSFNPICVRADISVTLYLCSASTGR